MIRIKPLLRNVNENYPNLVIMRCVLPPDFSFLISVFSFFIFSATTVEETLSNLGDSLECPSLNVLFLFDGCAILMNTEKYLY